LIGAFPEQGEAVEKALDNLRAAEKTGGPSIIS
jgi:hypothetical protein